MELQNLFGWSNQTWHTLDHWGILLALTVPSLTLLGVVWAFLKRERIRQWFTRNRFPVVPSGMAANTHWNGILFTVSHYETPNWVIDTVQPDFITLLATEKSRESADVIREYAHKRNIKVLDPIYVDNPDDIEEIKRECKHLLFRMRHEGAETLAVDITGGKTPMSLGAFMAAEEERAASVYVSVDYDQQLKKPDMRTASLTTLSQPLIP